MLGHGEHGLGGLAALPHDHRSHESSHHHLHHHEYLLWVIIISVFSFIVCKLVFKSVKHCHHRHCGSKLPTLTSQLSELSSQSDTFPNPLLANARTSTAVQAQGGIISKSQPDWMGNVPWSDWQIDQEEILLCRRPDGRLWELGSGASAKVPHASVTHLCPVVVCILNHACYDHCPVCSRLSFFSQTSVCLSKPHWPCMYTLFSHGPHVYNKVVSHSPEP